MSKSRTNKNVLSLIPNENLTNLNVKRSLNLSNSLNRANQIKEDEMEEAKNRNLVLTIPNEKYADQRTTQNLTIPPICKKKGRVIKRRHSKLLLRMCSRNLKGKDKSTFNSQVEGINHEICNEGINKTQTLCPDINGQLTANYASLHDSGINNDHLHKSKTTPRNAFK